ncbi:MAG: HepT-like ribonuclease domain-containing protein [Clostridium sp.]|uniref:HepT-like ribonuclease domain-containing protein n=1 Tax=Cetobacterium sp. TaxID=2071632 RepID=UPI003F2B3AD5
MSKAKRNIIQFTYDIEEFIEYIQEEMIDKSFNDFALDKKSIGYIERQLEKIGEAITQIQKLDKDILTKIYNNKSYWEGIKGVRNRLIHEYWGTSIQMIYEISVDEMDELLDYIKQIRKLEKSQIS